MNVSSGKENKDELNKLLEEGYVLKGTRNGETFDIAYNDNEEKLQKFKDEIQPVHDDIMMYIIEENKKLNEGIHLYAYGIDPDGNMKQYEDSDYKSKQDYKRDLEANEIKVKSILDNRDMYINEHSDYRNMADAKKQLKKYKQYYEDDGLITWKNRIDDLQELIDTASKISLTESKHKVEEVSRNELLAKAKKQTITRYNKSTEYRGFHIVDIDTTSILTRNCLRVTCKVGKYYDTVEMNDILYWIQVEAEKHPDFQVNTKGITAAIMNSIDGMDIKVDCECGDFVYRFAYMATKFGYKYGKPETREAKITNPKDIGSMCKHLISMLSNKKWLQQVTGTVMDWMVERIDEVNRFLKPKEGEELTLPNELARKYAKKGFYSKLFKDKLDDEPENDNENGNETTDTEHEEEPKSNVQGNNPSTNKVNNIEDEKEEGEE